MKIKNWSNFQGQREKSDQPRFKEFVSEREQRERKKKTKPWRKKRD